MKATLVYNTEEEPRVLLELETQEERTVLKDAPDLVCVRSTNVSSEEMDDENPGTLRDLAYALREGDDS